MPNNAAAEQAGEYISSLMAEKDSCGGIIECIADHLPVGLGEPVFDKLDALLAQAVMSIGAVKGVEIVMVLKPHCQPAAATTILSAPKTGISVRNPTMQAVRSAA